MLASYFKSRDNGEHLAEKLPDRSKSDADGYVNVMAEGLNAALYGNAKSIDVIKTELSGNLRVMDISKLKEKAQELFLALDYANTAHSEEDALDAIPMDTCTEIHRSMVAFNYAYVESNISMDSRIAYKPLVSSAHAADMSRLTNRYVLSTCTSIRMAEAAMYKDKDFGAEYMPLVLLLALKPLAGWETESELSMLDAYAQSELRFVQAMASLNDTAGLEHGPFQGLLSDSPVYMSLSFGNSTLSKLMTRHSEELDNLVSTFNRRIMQNNPVLSILAKTLILRVVHEDIEASIRAANHGLEVTEPALPKSEFVELQSGNSSVPAHVLSDVFASASFERIMNCPLIGKYRSTGFPSKCRAYVTTGINPAAVPVFDAYSAEHLVRCVLIPSTEHAAAMIRAMYGLQKPSPLATHTPSQEVLLGYAEPGYASRLSAKASMLGSSLLPLGKVDIRQFLFGTEPRQPQDCHPDELFHIFA